MVFKNYVLRAPKIIASNGDNKRKMVIIEFDCILVYIFVIIFGLRLSILMGSNYAMTVAKLF